MLAITGDWHVNDMVALCPPVFRREKSEGHHADKFQLAIWVAWKEYWQKVAEYKKALKAEVYALCLGDLGDLNKYSNSQLISPLRVDVERAMLDVIEPIKHVPDLWFVLRGTKAHSGAAGELEEWFADDIGAEPSLEGHKSWWIWRAEIEGVRIHATHHPPTKTKVTTKHGQAVSRMCERLAGEYDTYGWSDKPHLALWAHVHWSAPGYDAGVYGWTAPPWKGLGEYGHQIGVTVPNPVGGLIILLPGLGGQLWTVLRFQRKPPRAAMWTPEHRSRGSLTSRLKNWKQTLTG